MEAEITAGLSKPRKSIQSKYLYDEEGSRLFEQISRLPEYHVTRTELHLLETVAGELDSCIPAGAVLVEFGSGASLKTKILLDSAPHMAAYVAIDISATALDAAASVLRSRYPTLDVIPINADFTEPLALPQSLQRKPKVGFFPGSTIGNFIPEEAVGFLTLARRLLSPGGRLIIGSDATRNGDLLQRAYDDAEGVTAAFNLNLLRRLNRELGATFDLSLFRHRAIWNEAAGCVEMHLQSHVDQQLEVAGRRFHFAAGETIHTENSYKYEPDQLCCLAADAGWTRQALWLANDPAPLVESARPATFCMQILAAH
jgi:dimethylhistidine N-methyltransferase